VEDSVIAPSTIYVAESYFTMPAKPTQDDNAETEIEEPSLKSSRPPSLSRVPSTIQSFDGNSRAAEHHDDRVSVPESHPQPSASTKEAKDSIGGDSNSAKWSFSRLAKTVAIAKRFSDGNWRKRMKESQEGKEKVKDSGEQPTGESCKDPTLLVSRYHVNTGLLRHGR
jgi:hypothetical protein